MNNKLFKIYFSTAVLISVTLFNCTKKSDPAPTSSGTTTSTTTTTGTSTTGTSTSGTSTSGTSTSGTSTSGTIKQGSGSFIIDGVTEVADVVKSTPEASTKGITTIEFSNSKYSIQIRIGTDFLQDCIYKFTDFPIPSRNEVGVVIFPEPFVPSNYFTSNTGGNLTVQGNNLKIDFLTLLKNGDSKKEMKASCNISL